MSQEQYNTMHKKGKHLTRDEMLLIGIRLKDGRKANWIAKEIGCSANTVRNVIRKGMTSLYHGKVQRYKAETAYRVYQENRSHSHRQPKVLEAAGFLRYVLQHFTEDRWSLNACVGRAASEGIFAAEAMVCTKTLYNYIDRGMLEIKNIDLPQRISRKTKRKRVRENKRILGRSIGDRPESVNSREEFGHWETDLVIGSKSKSDNALLVLLERKTRYYTVLRLPNKEADSVQEAFEKIRSALGDKFGRVFKTITTDNGSEFARLAELNNFTEAGVFFTHPYTSCEKGSIENHNGLLRRFIRKGKTIKDYSDEDILFAEMWANQLPRKILAYKTPEELFDMEMDALYAT